jgi:hypothetical protein
VPIETVLATSARAWPPWPHGLVVARREGDRIVVSTTNLGAADSRLLIEAARPRHSISASSMAPRNPGGVDGFGRSEAGLRAERRRPLTWKRTRRSSSSPTTALRAPSERVVSWSSRPARLPEPAAGHRQGTQRRHLCGRGRHGAGRQVTASVVNNRVLVRQSRRG